MGISRESGDQIRRGLILRESLLLKARIPFEIKFQSPKSANNVHPNTTSYILWQLWDHNLCYSQRAIWCSYNIVRFQSSDDYTET